MKGLPEELAPAIKALKKSLHHAHSKCGRITEVFCYNQLHPGEKLAEVEEHKPAFRQLMAIVEPTIGPSYNQKIKTGTLPAVFSAMLDLYMAGVTVQAIQMFRDLVEIGREHEGQLAKPPVQWAHDLTLESVRFYENRVKMWVRAVCDPQEDVDHDPNDPYILMLGRTWCAPLLIVMRPSCAMPYDPERLWERTNRETTKRWLNSFAEMSTIQVELAIDPLADAEVVKLAKQPTLDAKAEASGPEHPPEEAPPQKLPGKLTVKQEYRRQKTRERDDKLRLEFRKLKKRKPKMSAVWYSEELAKNQIADGLNAETIRKIIRS
jgi:hypothetical protein